MSCIIDNQLNIQGFIRPGEWCYVFRAIRRVRQIWKCENNCNDVYEHLINVFNEILTDEDKKIMFSPTIKIIQKPYINCNRGLTIHLITLKGWLDTLDIIIESDNKGGSIIYLTLAATGLCTVTNPCSLLLNVLCCCFPFASMIQNDRLQILKNVCERNEKLKIVEVENLCNL